MINLMFKNDSFGVLKARKLYMYDFMLRKKQNAYTPCKYWLCEGYAHFSYYV